MMDPNRTTRALIGTAALAVFAGTAVALDFTSAHDPATGFTWRDSIGQSFSPSIAPSPDPGTPVEVDLTRFTFFRGYDSAPGAPGSPNTRLLIVEGAFPNIAALSVVGQSANTVDVTAASSGGGPLVFDFESLTLDFAGDYSALLVDDTSGQISFTSLQSTSFSEVEPFPPNSEYGGDSFSYSQLDLEIPGDTFVDASSTIDNRFIAEFSAGDDEAYILTTRRPTGEPFARTGSRTESHGQSFVPATGAPAELNLTGDQTVQLQYVSFFAGSFNGIEGLEGDTETRLAIFDRGAAVVGQEGNVQEPDDPDPAQNIVIDNANAALFNFITYDAQGSFGFEDAANALAISTNAVNTLDNGFGFPNGFATEYRFEFDGLELEANNAYEAVFVTVTSTTGRSDVLTVIPVTITFQPFDEIEPDVFAPHLEIGGTNNLNVCGLFDGEVFNDGTLRSASAGFDVAFDAAFTVPAPIACPGDADGDLTVDLDDFSVLAVQFGSAGPDADFDGSGLVDLDDFSILAVNFGADCTSN